MSMTLQRLKLILVFSDYHENIIIIRRLNLKPQYPELIMVYQFPPSQSFILFSGSRTKTFVLNHFADNFLIAAQIDN